MSESSTIKSTPRHKSIVDNDSYKTASAHTIQQICNIHTIYKHISSKVKYRSRLFRQQIVICLPLKIHY